MSMGIINRIVIPHSCDVAHQGTMKVYYQIGEINV